MGEKGNKLYPLTADCFGPRRHEAVTETHIAGAMCSPSGVKAYGEQWALAVARARNAFAIPSAYPLEAPTVRKGGAEAFIQERARIREKFEA